MNVTAPVRWLLPRPGAKHGRDGRAHRGPGGAAPPGCRRRGASACAESCLVHYSLTTPRLLAEDLFQLVTYLLLLFCDHVFHAPQALVAPTSSDSQRSSGAWRASWGQMAGACSGGSRGWSGCPWESRDSEALSVESSTLAIGVRTGRSPFPPFSRLPLWVSRRPGRPEP